jgi:thioredoxin 1
MVIVKILKLFKDGCVPCQNVSNFLDELNVEYDSINVFERPEVAAQYNLSSVPVTILLNDKDEEVYRSIGFKPNELNQIIQLIQSSK